MLRTSLLMIGLMGCQGSGDEPTPDDTTDGEETGDDTDPSDTDDTDEVPQGFDPSPYAVIGNYPSSCSQRAFWRPPNAAKAAFPLVTKHTVTEATSLVAVDVPLYVDDVQCSGRGQWRVEVEVGSGAEPPATPASVFVSEEVDVQGSAPYPHVYGVLETPLTLQAGDQVWVTVRMGDEDKSCVTICLDQLDTGLNFFGKSIDPPYEYQDLGAGNSLLGNLQVSLLVE